MEKRNLLFWIGFACIVLLTSSFMSPNAAFGQKDQDVNYNLICPMKVPGAKVDYKDVPDGGSWIFTTSTENLIIMRDRVKRMAAMHNEQSGKEGHMGMGHMMGRGMMGGMHGEGMMQMYKVIPFAKAQTEEEEGGVSFILKPDDPSKLEDLRKEMKNHAEAMAKGECPMMKTMQKMNEGDSKPE